MNNFRIKQSITNRQDASLSMLFREVSKIPLIDSDKEVELAKKAKKGDINAINELVSANLRFVISVAKQYQNKGLPLVDLIQEGSLGMIQAAKTFDESKGFKFISYAVWWIRQAIMFAISNQCRTVRIPMNQVANISKVTKAADKIEQLYERCASTEELCDATNLSESKINTAILSNTRSISLDTPFNDEELGCLLDVIPNSNADKSDKGLIQSDSEYVINDILSQLSYREQDVIRMAFGIGLEAMQNEEIANRFGITCERVRQITKEALEKIRVNHSDKLKELL